MAQPFRPSVWDIFKLCTPAHPPPRHFLFALPPTPRLFSAVQLISILFLPRTCGRKTDRQAEGEREMEWEEAQGGFVATQCSQFPQLDEEIVCFSVWMLHDLPAWNVNTKWSINIIPGAFLFSLSSSFSSTSSLPAVSRSRTLVGMCPVRRLLMMSSPLFTIFTISLLHSSFAFPFFSAKWPCPDIFPVLPCTSSPPPPPPPPRSLTLFPSLFHLPPGSVCKRAGEKNEGTNYETQECIPYLV